MDKPKYPVGIQTFEKIREGHYIYVDKTEFVYNLVSRGQFYFLSRPRRFGKSLLLSTIDAFYRGKRDLFDGLFIADKQWEWKEHPVFHLALNGQYYNNAEKLSETLHNFMQEWEEYYNLPKGNTSVSESTRFYNCIRDAHEATGMKVVILIDEYDQPLLQNLEQGKEDLYEEMKARLQAFYSVIKAQDKHICFGMLSGISKFSKVSVFSGLNNLQDISLEVATNAICGISETELDKNFAQGISHLALSTDMTIEETKERLKREYDGYHFAKSGEGIFNPFSVLSTFQNNDFSHYWIDSGTPSFIINLLKQKRWDLSRIAGSISSGMDLKGSDRYLSNPIPLLFQSGYLTIKSYDKEFDEYRLDYPNEEVAEGFTNDLLKNYSGDDDAASFITQLVKDIRKGDADAFLCKLQSLLADVPYDLILNRELHYENMMYLIMKLIGFYTHTEYKTSDGRIDMVVKTDRYIYIIEFKLHGSATEAIEQIKKKEYWLPFKYERKELILIGASFNDDTRRLDSWLIERNC